LTSLLQTLGYRSSHTQLLLDNESLTDVWILHLWSSRISRILVTLPRLVPVYNCKAAVIADTVPKGVILRISLLRSLSCATDNTLMWLSTFNSETVNLEPSRSIGALVVLGNTFAQPLAGNGRLAPTPIRWLLGRHSIKIS
jgi:hypothetical protein